MTTDRGERSLAPVSTLLPGDEITSPCGTWALVLTVEPATRTLTLDDAGRVVLIAIESWSTTTVLRRVPAAEAALRDGARPLTPQ